MRADDAFRVAYLGPSKGGKSLLLTGITDCTTLATHGYSPEFAPHIERVDPQTAGSPFPEPETTSLLERYKKVIARRPVVGFDPKVDHTRGGDGVGSTQSVKELFGRLTYQDGGRTETRPFHVFDSPGEVFFEESAGEVVKDGMEERKSEILAHVARAQALVFAISFSQLSNRTVSTGLHDILRFVADLRESAAANDPFRAPFRVVIALTRYDSLFLHLGSFAFEAASEPEVAAYAIQKALKPHREAYHALAELDLGHPGCFDIRFAPTSAFGFLPRFGCPNIDPGHLNEQDVRGGKSPNLFLDSGTARTVFPFLTADPFIFAITGIKSDFIVDLSQALDGHPRSPQPATRSTAPVGAAGSDAAINIFDVKVGHADPKSGNANDPARGGSRRFKIGGRWLKSAKDLASELLR